MSQAQAAPPAASRHYNACSRCQFILEDITRFFVEEAQCSVAQASTEELLQRAQFLILSMADAMYHLGLEVPENQRDLWVAEQIEKYIAAIEALCEFEHSMSSL